MAHLPFHCLDDDDFNFVLSDDNTTLTVLNLYNVSHFDYIFDKCDNYGIN